MKFVGKPNGKFLKGAPGNFTHGEIYTVPYRHSKTAYWELIEEIPELTVPDIDEELEESYYIPEDEPTIENTISAILEGVDVNPNTPAIIEPYMTIDGVSGKMKEYKEPEPVELSRKDLKKILDDAGVKYNKRTRTENLKKLVDALEEAD